MAQLYVPADLKKYRKADNDDYIMRYWHSIQLESSGTIVGQSQRGILC